VRFTPTGTDGNPATPGPDPYVSQIGINSNDPDMPIMNIGVSGTGVGAQDITVAPLSVSFGNVQVGQSSTQTIQIKNEGTAALLIDSISSPSVPFSIVGNNCPIQPSLLAVGASCQVDVRFSPLVSGATASKITVSSDDPDEDIVDVNLSGAGIVTPDISVTPTFKNFASTMVGSTTQQIFNVQNIGTANLQILSLSNPGGEFSIVSSNCIGELQPLQQCAVTVVFKPVSEGLKQSSFTISSNDPDTPSFAVLLSGTGTTQSASSGHIRVSSMSLDFGDVKVGSNGFRSLTVVNDGASGLSISSVSKPSSPFRIDDDGCTAQVLATGEMCKIKLAFNPTFVGTYNPYYIYISSSDPDQSTVKVQMMGKGIDAEQLLFMDVLSTYWAVSAVNSIYNTGITVGCYDDGTTRLFCPETPVTRAGMAVFIIKAIGQVPSIAAYNAYFNDVANDGFAPYINRMSELLISAGCGPGVYCPNDFISRAQMAVFIIRALGETPSPVAYNAYFADIANDGFAGYINRMLEMGITTGCGSGIYCPNDAVTRAQMSVFLYNAFIKPTGVIY
jgi:hypothetical protein